MSTVPIEGKKDKIEQVQGNAISFEPLLAGLHQIWRGSPVPNQLALILLGIS